MSRHGSDQSASTAVSNRRRFAPGYDFAYRFGSANTFRRVKQVRRPYTSPSLTSADTHATVSYRQAYKSAIASTRSPSVKMIRESLGDGILMLRQERQYIKPSIFLNLDKIYMDKPPVSAPSPTVDGSRALLITPQPPIPVRAASRKKPRVISAQRLTKSPEPTLPRYSSRGVQVNVSSPTPANANRRPSTAAEIVVDFLTHGGAKVSTAPSAYPARSGYFSQQMDIDDRCMRSSDYPEIQIEGRSLSRTMRAENTHMAREYCDVLGPLTCPDCIRTRIQNNHQRMCNAVVAANATDVYKLALIHERIPHLSMKEVQRKIFDGEISDKVDKLSRWREIQHAIQAVNAAKEHNEQPDDTQESSQPATAAGVQEKPLTSKLKSRGSTTSAAFEPIPEASEATDSEPEEGGEAVAATDAKSEGSSATDDHHVVIKRHAGELPQKIDVVTSSDEDAEGAVANAKIVESDDKLPSADAGNESHSDNEAKQVTDIADEQKPDQAEIKTEDANDGSVVQGKAVEKKQRRRRKRSPKLRQLRVFNRGLIPSPNYFFNVSDLMSRVQKSERRAPRAPWDVEIIQIKPEQVEAPGEEVATDQHDDASSVSSQSSTAAKVNQSLRNFEPPIMFEKKGRYLGVKAPTAGSLASTAQTAVS